MSDFAQATRSLRVPLGDVPDDEVLLTGLSGTETLSGLFSFTLTLVSSAATPLRFVDVLGKPAAVAIDTNPDQTRHIHGVIRRLRQTHSDHVHSHYRAELEPPLWLLTRTNLWATERVSEPIPAGTETFDPKVDGMNEVKVVEHPWDGAHWRDGVAPGGADQPADLAICSPIPPVSPACDWDRSSPGRCGWKPPAPTAV